MSQVQLVAVILEQLRQPLPAIGGLERDLGLAVEPAEQRHERVGVVDDPAREPLPPSSSRAATCERLRCRSMPTELIEGPPSIRTSDAPEGIAPRAPER